MQSNDFKMVAISETWFNGSVDYYVTAYKLFHKDKTSRGGGAALYICDIMILTKIR